MLNRVWIVVLALLAGRAAAKEELPNFSFVEVSIGYVDFDDFDSAGTPLVDIGIDIKRLYAGIGYFGLVSERTRWDARLGHVRDDAELDFAGLGASGDENGYLIAFSVRTRWTTRSEAEFGADNDNFQNDSDETLVRLDGRYFFSPQLYVGLGAARSDDRTILRGTLRYSFE